MAKLELGDSTVQEIIRMCVKSELRMVDGKICLSPSESQDEPTAWLNSPTIQNATVCSVLDGWTKKSDCGAYVSD